MPHSVMSRIAFPVDYANPVWVQQALGQVELEMDQAARGLLGEETIETRLDRLEAFVLLSAQHTANVHNSRI